MIITAPFRVWSNDLHCSVKGVEQWSSRLRSGYGAMIFTAPFRVWSNDLHCSVQGVEQWSSRLCSGYGGMIFTAPFRVWSNDLHGSVQGLHCSVQSMEQWSSLLRSGYGAMISTAPFRVWSNDLHGSIQGMEQWSSLLRSGCGAMIFTAPFRVWSNDLHCSVQGVEQWSSLLRSGCGAMIFTAPFRVWSNDLHCSVQGVEQWSSLRIRECEGNKNASYIWRSSVEDSSQALLSNESPQTWSMSSVYFTRAKQNICIMTPQQNVWWKVVNNRNNHNPSVPKHINKAAAWLRLVYVSLGSCLQQWKWKMCVQLQHFPRNTNDFIDSCRLHYHLSSRNMLYIDSSFLSWNLGTKLTLTISVNPSESSGSVYFDLKSGNNTYSKHNSYIKIQSMIGN